MEHESLLSAKEAAAVLGISSSSIKRLFTSGDLRAMRAGPKLWRTQGGWIRDYIERQAEETTAKSQSARHLPAEGQYLQDCTKTKRTFEDQGQ